LKEGVWTRSTWTPDRILKTSGAYWATCALHGAVVLDVFTRIGDNQVDGQTVADQLNAPVDAVSRLAGCPYRHGVC
jgi:hypothetical protein